MNDRQLRSVVVVASRGSFTAAADEIGISEPGLHKQIRRLETELGVSLFERVGQGMRLTNHGHYLLETVHHLVDEIDGLSRVSDHLAGGAVGIVTVGCFPVHLVRFLGNAIASFERDNPGLEVRLGHHPVEMTEARHDFARKLLAKEVDVACGVFRPPAGVHSFRTYVARGIAILADDHPLRHSPTIEVSSLRGERLIGLPRGLWFLNRFEQACRDAGFRTPLTVLTTVEAVIALAIAGYGIGVMTDDNLWGRPCEPYPYLVDPSEAELSMPSWLYWRNDIVLAGPVKAFIEHVRTLQGR